MKILPIVHKGIVLMHEDGSFEMAPFQVFRGADGGTVIRIGHNAIFFDKKGAFDGTECRVPASVDAQVGDDYSDQLAAAFDEQGRNRGKAPTSAYFGVDSRGWHRETAAWASCKPDDAPAEDVTSYAIKGDEPTVH